MVRAVFSLAIIFLVSATFTMAQSADVNFQSLKIAKTGIAGVSTFDLRGVDSNQRPVQFLVYDTAIEGNVPYIQCSPCRAPQLFPSDIFRNPIHVQIGQSSTLIDFYITNRESDPIYLGSRVFSKKTNFYMNGKIKLSGRIEVVDRSVVPNKIIAVDNNVTFEGRYSILFAKPFVSSGRLNTSFLSLEYDWVQTGN